MKLSARLFEILFLTCADNRILTVISFYLPPDNQRNKNNNQLTEEIFAKLESFKPYVLLGDLNCHSTIWFCSKTSPKDAKLNDLQSNPFNPN